MKYDPSTHNRRSIRLKGYDYSKAGAYFITICCHEKEMRFGKIINSEIVLNEFGQIAFNEWLKLPERFPNIELDAFVIMPNHMHGIIFLKPAVPVGATLAVAPSEKNRQKNTNDGDRVTARFAPTIGNIIGAYKSIVANECLKIYKSKNEGMGNLWQRNYHEHIIQSEKAYLNIADYIVHNPERWDADVYFSEN